MHIESTIPSSIAAHPARDLTRAAPLPLTQGWRNSKCEQPELFSSQIVLDEIAGGEPTIAQRRLEIVSGLTLLERRAAADDRM